MTNHNISFSIIIPHYTKTDTTLLERCVRSTPDRDDIEVLVIDNSPKEIDADLFNFRNNVKILYSEKGKGAGCARNKGLECASGKWLIFMDADDYLTENAFSHFDTHVDDSVDIIYFKTTSVDNLTGIEAKRHLKYNRLIDEFEDRIPIDNGFKLRVFHYVPWGKMIKREFVIQNKFLFDEIPASNDVVFCTKTGLAAHNIGVDYHIVYCTTVTEGSLTKTKNLKNFSSRFFAYSRCNAVLKQNGYRNVYSMGVIALKARRYGLKPLLYFLFVAAREKNFYVANRFRKEIRYR